MDCIFKVFSCICGTCVKKQQLENSVHITVLPEQERIEHDVGQHHSFTTSTKRMQSEMLSDMCKAINIFVYFESGTQCS